MNRVFKQTLLTTSIVVAIVSQQAYATNGYASHGFGMTQKAMGGTAVAGSDNAMNMATNPASLSFGENNWTGGLDLFRPVRGMNDSGVGAIPGKSLDGNEDSLFPVPEFAYQKHINNKYSAGVAVYGNGGMNATYDSRIFSSFTNGKNTGIDFSQLFVAPSASMKINDKNAIGASINLVYQRIKVDGVSDFGDYSSDPANLSDSGYDHSRGAGFSLGWQGQVTPMVKAGLAYRSKTHMSKFENYKGLLAEQGDFDIPSMITAGISVQATPRTTLAFDVARINYTDVKAISNINNTADLQRQIPNSPRLGDDEGAGFGWEDQNIVKVGVQHKLNTKVTLLGGFNHGKTPIGDDQTAFNILAPATVEDHLTLGMDWKLNSNSKITVSYMHAFENEIKGDGTMTQQGPASPGSITQVGPNQQDITAANIKMKQDAIGIAYTRSF